MKGCSIARARLDLFSGFFFRQALVSEDVLKDLLEEDKKHRACLLMGLEDVGLFVL